MTRCIYLAAILGGAIATFAACSPSISGNTGGASETSSTASSSVTSSAASTSASSTTSSTVSTSASSTSSTTSSTSSGGATCPTGCTTDAECQSGCPDPGPGSIACCGLYGCYMPGGPKCPPPCEPGAACQPGDFCTGAFANPNSCVDSCACDATGHYACTLYTDYPSCPAVHPACGDPCDPSTTVYCKCTTDGGASGCTCDPGTSTWDCGAGICNLFDHPPKAKCTDFPVGTVCGDVCQCNFVCGTQVWQCTI